ncbi:hypothetical protein [Duck adenovirus 1]|uniref:Ig-like domain-containing protein n=1 Tax=Duck adenovirus 1 TaxID=130329 RepID=A0A0D3MVZ4_DADV1|nr:hypothetical protein [Duck adenovirus 1]AJA72376.1 hypothetical protein [Duck adenovirus 1]
MQPSIVLVCILIPTALCSQVDFRGPARLIVGSTGTFHCSLPGNRDVLAITWKHNDTNVGALTQSLGHTVVVRANGTAILRTSNYSVTSLTLLNITYAVAGAYTCIFNVFPDGAISGHGVTGVDDPPQYESISDGALTSRSSASLFIICAGAVLFCTLVAAAHTVLIERASVKYAQKLLDYQRLVEQTVGGVA